MLLKIDIHAASNGALLQSFPIVGASPYDAYKLSSVTGLGPTKVELSHDKNVTSNGVFVRNAWSGSRNVVFSIDLRPYGNDIQTLRHRIYRTFEPSNLVQVRVYSSDKPTMMTTGYVESVDFELYSRDPKVQISIFCEEPHLKGIAEVKLSGKTNTPISIWDQANAKTPFRLELFINKPASIISIHSGLGNLVLDGSYFNVGDVARVSSEPGNKFVSKRTGSTTSYALDSIRSGTLDLSFGGVNVGNVLVNSSDDMNVDLYFTPRWLGV